MATYAALAEKLPNLARDPSAAAAAAFVHGELRNTVGFLLDPAPLPTDAQLATIVRCLAACAELCVAQIGFLLQPQGEEAPSPPPAASALPYIELLAQMSSEEAALWAGTSRAPPSYGGERLLPRATRANALALLHDEIVRRLAATEVVLRCLDGESLLEAELTDAVLQFAINVAEAHRKVHGAAALLDAVSQHMLRAMGEIKPARLKQQAAQALLVVTQRLQLLVSPKSTDSTAEAFGAVVPPRIALLAKALSSSTLTVKLWAVKDAAQLIAQAHGLADNLGQAGVSAAAAKGDCSASSAPLLVASELIEADVPKLLLGDTAHEEVLARATPIFLLLLQTRKLNEERLKLLWSAAATKSAAVAQRAAASLVELLRSPHCPPELLEQLLHSLGTYSGCDEGFVSMLSSLAAVYVAAAPPLAERYIALLWRLLILPPDRSAHPARAALQSALVSALANSSSELRFAGLLTAVKPLQRACAPPGSPSAATRRSLASAASSRSLVSAGSDGGKVSSDEDAPPRDEPRGAVSFRTKAAPADLLLSEKQSDQLPLPTAMAILRGVVDSVQSTLLPPLLSQLEAKVGIWQIAQQLAASSTSALQADLPATEASAVAPPHAADAAAASTSQPLLDRLSFLVFVATELRTSLSKTALEAAWAARQTDEEREALLLWLPSAVPVCSLEALSYGYLELLLKGPFHWESLSVEQYRAFESLFRHYHTSKGGLRFTASSAESTAGGLWFLSKLWRGRKAAQGDEAQTELSRLQAEMQPSSFSGIQQLWLAICCAPEETSRMAMPLLVQLHLRPVAQLDLAVVRQELLQGTFHALHHLCQQYGLSPSVAASKKATVSPRVQSQVLQLLDLLEEFVCACGESRKLVPHAATMRGQSLKLTVQLAPAAASPTPANASGAIGSPQNSFSADTPAGGGGSRALGGLVNALASVPGTHRRSGSHGMSSSSHGGALAVSRPSLVPAAVSTIVEAPKVSQIELEVHDNLTLGLLRNKVKHSLIAAGLPRTPHRFIVLCQDGAALEGEMKTLRELQLTEDVPLTLRLPSSKLLGTAAKESRDVKHEQRSTLPGYMIAHSSSYMECLFEVIQEFGRSSTIVQQTWELLMRVPTYAQRVSALNRPDLVNWHEELALLEREPMRVLYMMQIISAKLLPAYIPAEVEGHGQQMAVWKSRFMEHGFFPLFSAFKKLADKTSTDTLHATMLCTTLSVVRACLVGYIFANLPSHVTSSVADAVEEQAESSYAKGPGLPSSMNISTGSSQSSSFSRSGSVSSAMLKGFSVKALPLARDAGTRDDSSTSLAAAGDDVRKVAPDATLTKERLFGERESEEFWSLAQLLLTFATRRVSFGSEHQRQMSLDLLKLLDAVVNTKPDILDKFISLPLLEPALAQLLLRARDRHVRKQASIFVTHMCHEAPHALAVTLGILERLLPEAAESARTSAEYFELLELLLRRKSHSPSPTESPVDISSPSPNEAAAGMPSSATLLPNAESVASTLPSIAVRSFSDASAATVEVDDVRLCRSLLDRALRYPCEKSNERHVLGLLQVLSTQARSSAACQLLLGNRLGDLISLCLVPGDHSQPSDAVRHAAMELLRAACESASNVRLLLPILEDVHARDVIQEWGIDPAKSIRSTHVGIVNQGATCYMNALLQQFFMTPAFRDGILAATPPHSQRTRIFSEMQLALANLKYGLRPVYDAVNLVSACEELPMTYGAFQQNDAAEFLMLLAAHLEDVLKGTRHAELLSQCFGGKFVQQVIWQQNGVRKVSEREESFLQIELKVQGNPDIEHGLREMIDGEMLEGENAYELNSGEKVDAQKRTCLGALPETLIIQLKRFQLDYETMSHQKLNSACAFPTLLDLEPFTKRGLDARATKTVAVSAPEWYELVGVVVHAGNSNFGHYFSLIKSREGAQSWMMFNDRQVTDFDVANLGAECYGGVKAPVPPDGHAFEKTQNGFLLFYRKKQSTKPEHRRSGSAPAGFRHQLGRSVSPMSPINSPHRTGFLPVKSPEAMVPFDLNKASGLHNSTTLSKEPATLNDSKEKDSPKESPVGLRLDERKELSTPSRISRGSGKLERLEQAMLDSAAVAALPEAEALTPEQRLEALLHSVHQENSHLLLRQHLFDTNYICFLLDLLRLNLETSSSLIVGLRSPPPVRNVHESTDNNAQTRWELPAALQESLAVHQVQMCARFFFGYLLHLEGSLLEPHLNGERSWLTAFDQVCEREPLAGLWLMHALLEPLPPPRDPVPSVPSVPCWLLAALFDCECAAARQAVVQLAVTLVRRIAMAELEEQAGAQMNEAAAADSAKATHAAPSSHAHAFMASLLDTGLWHAASTSRWAEAAPLLELLLSLLKLPAPVGPYLCQLVSQHGALLSLAAYVIGDSATDLEISVELALSGLPRPQRTRTPHLLVPSEKNREGVNLLLEALARLVTFTDHAAGDEPRPINLTIARRDDASNSAIHSPTYSMAPVAATYEDVICTEVFIAAALHACVRSGGEGIDALCQITERLCRGSESRSALLLREALRGVRSDSEIMSSLSAQLLLHHLQLQDELLPLRCSMALKKPHGLIGMVLDHIGPNAKSDNAATTEDGNSTSFSEAARCYTCIRLVLEVNGSSKAAAQWLDDILNAEDVELMVRWLKEASRTAALGKATEKGRFLGVARRRGSYERTVSQQNTLEQLRGVYKHKKASR